MKRLISEGMAKARNAKRFWICTWILIGLSLLQVLLNYAVEKQSSALDSNVDVSSVIFGMLGNQSLFMAIVPAMFVVRDFTQNTVRNKIICGHSRTQIYFAHLICFDAVALFYHIVATLSSLIFGLAILGGADSLAHGYVAYYCVHSVLLILAYASMTMFICMLIRGVSGAIIAYVINTLLSTFGMIAMLALNGHDKLVDLITCAVLDMQTSLLLEGITSPGEYPNSFMRVAMPLFALAYIIALPIIGVRIFKQTDLK